ncbi:MAG: TldD/PmbA family protein [Candidatus Tectomicrobia bacterium]|uniref:TldD/PmbA family protein n=1 Tax=Tectimicrobiota bacterium TaxID=2528274 RepID=A0A933LRW4_UNCTE|nr:TldD/PmbA family protein [Candidatus Tectomicrobia bacterium]
MKRDLVTDLLRDLAERVAKEKLGELELFLIKEKTVSIEVFNQTIDTFQLAQTQGVGLRLLKEGRCGYSFTEKIDQPSLEKAFQQASANAAINAPDESYALSQPNSSYPKLDLINEEIERVPLPAKIEMAKALEKKAKSYDSRIINVPSSYYGEGRREVTLINSLGLEASFASNLAGLAIDIMAQQTVETKSAFRHKTSRGMKELNPEKIAKEAAKEGVDLLGARSISTGNYPVVFTPETGRQILGAFTPIFSAKNVQEGKSLLLGKLNHQLAASSISLIDNPLLPAGLASRPFDDEGTPSRVVHVIKDGTLQSYLHNNSTARKDGVPSTGHARRASIKSALDIAPSNFLLSTSGTPHSSALLPGKVEKGIMVVNLHGLHSGTNAISGDFSLGAQGFFFEGGEILHPVHNFTIAGNFLSLLQDILELGDDFEPGPTGAGGSSICTPSFLVSSLSVSGS